MDTTASNPSSSIAKWRLAIASLALLVFAVVLGVGYNLLTEKTQPTAEKSGAGIEDSAIDNPGDAKAAAKDAEPEIVRLSSEVARKYGVRIGVAKKRKLVSRIVAPARVSFNDEATAVISSPIQGRAIAIPVRAGDTVERGAELLVLESTELGEAQSDFLQKRTAAAAARMAVEPALNIYARARQLYEESQGIRLTELQKREVELLQAQAALSNAEAAAVAAENKLHLLGLDRAATDELLKSGKVNPLYFIRSPLAGRVIERNVNLGELVKPDREKLFVAADTSTLWVWADIPETRVREIAEGALAQVSSADRTFTGTVSHLAPTMDPQTRSLRVRIEMKSDPELKPGMFAQVEIIGKADGASAEPVLTVPVSAIQTVSGSTVVFIPVKGEANTFKMRVVTTGNCVDGQICITSGLAEGERIVIAGSAILKADLLKASAKDED